MILKVNSVKKDRPVFTTKEGGLVKLFKNSVVPYAVLKCKNAMPSEDLQQLAREMGIVQKHPVHGVVTEIISREEERDDSIAKSLGKAEMHTDGTYMDNPPSGILMQCVQPGGSSGRSLLLPIDHVLRPFKPHHFEVLRSAIWKFRRPSFAGEKEQTFCGPLLNELHGQPVLRWRYDRHVRPELIWAEDEGLAKATMEWIAFRVRNSKPVVYGLEENDILLVVNHFRNGALHGREAIERGDENRHLRRVWFK